MQRLCCSAESGAIMACSSGVRVISMVPGVLPVVQHFHIYAYRTLKVIVRREHSLKRLH